MQNKKKKVECYYQRLNMSGVSCFLSPNIHYSLINSLRDKHFTTTLSLVIYLNFVTKPVQAV